MSISTGSTGGQIGVGSTAQNSIWIGETRKRISTLVISSFTGLTLVLSRRVALTVFDSGQIHTFSRSRVVISGGDTSQTIVLIWSDCQASGIGNVHTFSVGSQVEIGIASYAFVFSNALNGTVETGINFTET